MQETLAEATCKNLISVFVSIDPRRDTCEQVSKYIEGLPGKFLGLTGSPLSVKKMSRLFRVYYNEGFKATDDDYLIDHSIIHYLIGPTGEFIDFFGKNMSAKEIASRIEGCISSPV